MNLEKCKGCRFENIEDCKIIEICKQIEYLDGKAKNIENNPMTEWAGKIKNNNT